MVQHCKSECQSINSYSFFSRVILQTASNKRLREEESAHPENLRRSIVNPFIQKFDPCNEIFNPATKWLQAEEALICPQLAYLVIEYTVAQLL